MAIYQRIVVWGLFKAYYTKFVFLLRDNNHLTIQTNSLVEKKVILHVCIRIWHVIVYTYICIYYIKT